MDKGRGEGGRFLIGWSAGTGTTDLLRGEGGGNLLIKRWFIIYKQKIIEVLESALSLHSKIK